MNRVEKAALVQKFKDTYSSSECLVVLDYKGADVKVMSAIRSDLRKNCNARLSVLKNKLNKIAVSGTHFDSSVDSFVGQTAIVVCQDIVEVCKIVNKYCIKDKKISFIGLYIPKEMYDIEYVKKIATLPSMDMLKAQLLAVLNSPASSLLYVMQEPGNALARLSDAYSRK